MSNLIKLHKALKHNEASTDADRHPFWKLFEIIVAVYIEELFGIIVFLWSDVPIAIRDKLGLPKQDTGVDFITEDLRVMGQAKYYTTGQIGSGDMSRTRLCAYIASENDNDTKLVLVGSTDVKISSVSSKRDGFKCVQINNTDDLNKFYSDKQKISYAQHILTTAQIDAIIERAKNVVIPVSVTQSIATLPLRQCQLDAMAAIKKEGITRLNMACASGKSKMIMSHIIKPGNGFSHLILVPSVMLMEQWNDLVKEYICAYPELNINLISIGTGHNDKFDDRLANAGFDFDIYICVYNSYSYVEKMTFDTVTIDEAHHIDKKSFETETYLSKIASIKNAIYLSASFPKREIDYKYPIRQAINDGILTDYDIIIPYSNDLNVNVDNMLIKYFLHRTEFLSILVYFNRISEIEAFVEMCKMNNIKALSLSCEESITKRTEILDKLRSGEIRLIASVNTLGEGIDLRNVDVCCFARTRESEFSIIQCIGRILRKHPTKKLAHVILPVDTNNLEDIPIINFLAKIAKFDDVYYKDFVQKKSNRISFVNMNEIKIDIGTKVDTDNIEELVLDKTCSIVNDSWMVKYQVLKAYYELNKKFPVRIFICENGSKLGQWFSTQKKYSDKMDINRVKLLDDLNPNWKDVQKVKNDWNDNYQVLKSYYDLNKKFPVTTFVCENGFKLGHWFNKQKGNRDKMDTNRVKLLDDLNPNWKNVKNLTDIWDYNYKALKSYYDLNKKFPIRTFVCENGFKLGEWLQNQKENRDKMDTNRVKLLDDLNPNWKNVNVIDWNSNYKVLKTYYDLNKKFPESRFVCENGFKLGQWWTYQKTKRDTLDTDKCKLLDDLNPDWKNMKVIITDWNVSYQELKSYYDINKKFPISTFVCENGFKLGHWFSTQKAKRDTLDINKVKLLDELNPNWKNVKNKVVYDWNDSYQALKSYYDLNKKFPENKFVCENGFKLGSWFAHQKQYRDTLDSTKVALFNALNPNWSNVKTRIVNEWNDNYQVLKSYYDLNKKFPERGFVCENGFKLGSWFSDQKKNMDCLNVDKVKLLDGLNPIWKKVNIRVKKNLKTKTVINKLWTKNAELLNKYRELNKHLPTIDQDANLFQWIEDNKKLYLENKLSEDQIVALNLIDVRILPDIDPHIFPK